MTTSSPLPCPNCGAALDLSRAACVLCGLSIQGPQAARLWQVDQQIATLRHERAQLITSLLRSSQVGVPVGAGPGHPVPGFPQQPGPYARPHARASAPSAQQLLLGLGALLTLSAALFFGWVVWMIVGIWGQALILVGLTAVAATGAVLATRHRLPAAAETAAVIASGLTVIGLWAAWSLNLAGLQEAPGFTYAAVAAVVAGLLGLLFDRLVPRVDREGQDLRPIVSYEPFAAAMLTAAPWFFLMEVAPEGVWLPVGLLLVALVCTGLWFGVRHLCHVPAAQVAPAFGAVLAAAFHLVTGLATAHDVGSPTREWSALLLLAVAAAIGVVGARRLLPGRLNGLVPLVVTGIALPAAWSFTWEAHWSFLLAAAVLAALALVGLAQAPLSASATRSLAHVCAQVALAIIGVGLTTELWVLHLSDEPRLWRHGVGVGPDLVLVALVAGAWAVAAVWAAVRWRSVGWLVFAHAAITASVAIALFDSGARPHVLVWLAVAAALAALSAAVVLTGAADRRGWRGWDAVIAVFALVHGVLAVLASTSLPHPWTAWLLVVTGVLAYAWSLLPGRLLVAYGASPVIALGIQMLIAHRDAPVEAFTLPLALLLATIGVRHWQRNRAVHSWVSMGPALGAAFLPTVLVAIDEGDALRLALSSGAAVLVLVAGLALRLQAPVTVAAVSLVLIAITQGGPYIAMLPGWLTLGIAGAVLLTVGVAWERAVLAGRRGSAWFGSLR
ncbi:MAG: hypothetical protein LT071_06080 [Nocardioides sp.]|nr:hypothetical protein [Nocardioides sp.]